MSFSDIFRPSRNIQYIFTLDLT